MCLLGKASSQREVEMYAIVSYSNTLFMGCGLLEMAFICKAVLIMSLKA